MTMHALAQLRASLPLKVPTDPRWSAIAIEHLPLFLADHASCERKAHAAAMMMVNRYPEYPELQDRMIRLAKEELLHFEQVVKLMRQRDIPLRADEVDPYVKSLLAKARHPKDQHLLDRLLLVAILEARSCERFSLFAEALPGGDLKHFYENFALEEAEHFPLFVSTAKLYYSEDIVDKHLEVMFSLEAEIMTSLELRPTVH